MTKLKITYLSVYIVVFLVDVLITCVESEMAFTGESEKHELILLRRLIAEEVPPSTDLSEGNGSFILATERTRRRDPMDEFKEYTGGWNISNEHYWTVRNLKTLPHWIGFLHSRNLLCLPLHNFFLFSCYFSLQSMAFTAMPLLAIALVWLVGFGLALFFICCCYCCCRRQSYSYSRMAYAFSLILLILFTLAVM